MKTSIWIYLAFLAWSAVVVSAKQQDDPPDFCGQSRDSSKCLDSDLPYYCIGRNEPTSTFGTCFSEGLCCCESRDGLFASSCTDGDICCDGGCCNPEKSFCCGGGCCDMENEVCCRGECIGGSSNGTRRWFPTIVHVLLAAIFVVFVGLAPKDLRLGRLTSFAILFAMMGFLLIVVGVSAWDCSPGIKFVVALGTIEAFLGLLGVFFRMCWAYSKKQPVTFGMERFVMVEVDSQGNVKQVAVADQETQQVARTELAAKNGDDSKGAISLRLADVTEDNSE